MSHHFSSRLGAQLYQLLPELYVTRDKEHTATGALRHPLASYLDAHGLLLDSIHGTIEQLLSDSRPGSSQEWLVPYFARLVATTVISPDLEGKHAEIANAIGWRQRKGTLKCAEAIAEAVGRTEVELQEGWTRVAITPHVGRPLLPVSAIDATCDPNPHVPGAKARPGEKARHPALPAVTVDFGRPSRAVGSAPGNPATRTSTFTGITKSWRHANPHGAPCFPGSYEDVSRRTVDIRTPDDPNGCYHHKRVLLFAPPPDGFFAGKETLPWAKLGETGFSALIEKREEGGTVVIRNRSGRILQVAEDVQLQPRRIRIEGIHFLGTLSMPSGGHLTLSGVEAHRVEALAASDNETVLTATDCLFRELYAPRGLVHLDSCTILGTAHLDSIWATDSIFMAIAGDKIIGDLQYCRVPEAAIDLFDWSNTSSKSNKEDGRPITVEPVYFAGQHDLSSQATLTPDVPMAISQGASDRGELGYFHHGRRSPVHIKGAVALSAPPDGGHPLEDIVFKDAVTLISGRLSLRRASLPKLTIKAGAGGDHTAASLSARDCLFQSIDARNHLVRLEYCTVMKTTRCKHLQASDCIFVGDITLHQKNNKAHKDNLEAGGAQKQMLPSDCIRYSSVPPTIRSDQATAVALHLIDSGGEWTLRTNTIDRPVFGTFRDCDREDRASGPAKYACRGYGVIDLHSPSSIRFGAEDGGELGAYHHKQYALMAAAMLAKIREFLPIGIEPVLIEDQRLLHAPPEHMKST